MTSAATSDELYSLVKKLYPMCRSITGNGVRQTLKILSQHIPLQIHEVPSGTAVLDWTVPQEWNINDAYVANSLGEKVVDFQKNNLHVVNYSVPINQKMSLQKLKKHFVSLPDRPDLIPYRTTYYDEEWGFCLSHKELQKLKEDTYTVVIDSTLKKGSLTYGEFYINGQTKKEVLISTHICHPSMCNDNLSGITVAVHLAQLLSKQKPYYSYRFLFIPGTIGSITWLARNEQKIKNIKHGLVLTGLGDKANFTYKKSRVGDTEIDQIVEYALQTTKKNYTVQDFSPFGYDERQYCSPGFNIPVGCLMRSQYDTYPEYHTSADNLQFVSGENLNESLQLLIKVINILEQNKKYLNLFPKGEPQLGKRGLYKAMGSQSSDKKALQLAMLWILNFSDREHSLLDISIKSKLPFEIICQAASLLSAAKLLKAI